MLFCISSASLLLLWFFLPKHFTNLHLTETIMDTMIMNPIMEIEIQMAWSRSGIFKFEILSHMLGTKQHRVI